PRSWPPLGLDDRIMRLVESEPHEKRLVVVFFQDADGGGVQAVRLIFVTTLGCPPCALGDFFVG
ncbi:MAG: hypothetical protein RLZZ214_932, partial [Verrucomicrobiota bacterium]